MGARMKVNSKTGRVMDLEFVSMLKAINMKDYGKKV
jgi:hypothetical protein